MKKALIAGFVVCQLFVAGVAGAKNIEFDPANIGLATQADFDNFIADLGTATHFTPMAPAKTLGIIGLDFCLETVVADVGSKPSWQYMVEDNDTFSYLTMGRFHVQKGLPFKTDIGAMVLAVPNSNIQAWGVELKHGIIKEGLVLPSLTVRGSYTQLEGVDDIGLKTYSLDLLLSKDFLMVTPYGGVSALRIEGRDESQLATGFQEAKEDVTRAIAGLQISPFPLCIISAEASFGRVPMYGIKIGMGF
ncbi:MAG: hypothetical protein K9N55_03895 [Phycisphaerae bacterium]|nr:hypothetical protein [Phycisphaerae bacterium]